MKPRSPGLYFVPPAKVSTLDFRHDSPLYRLNLTNIGTKSELMYQLKQLLPLPDYFAHNWDSLSECLKELPVNSVLIVTGIENLNKHAENVALLLLEILTEWAKNHGIVYVERKQLD